MRLSYPLTTARLHLRPFQAGDAEDLFAYLSLPEVCRYLYESPLATLADVREPLAHRMAQTSLREEGDSLTLAVLLPQADRVIGNVLLHYSSRSHRQGEIGFVFHPAYHQRGYAAEAAQLMLRIGFESLQLHRVIGRCDARNHSSARLMERLGMSREAHLIENEFVKGAWTDEYIYAIREGSWKSSGLDQEFAPELLSASGGRRTGAELAGH